MAEIPETLRAGKHPTHVSDEPDYKAAADEAQPGLEKMRPALKKAPGEVFMKVFARFAGIAIAALALTIFAGQNEESIVVKKPFDQHKPAGSGNVQILYHGGKILTASVPIYVIYYGGIGSFPSTTQPIVNSFLAGLGGTPQFDVNTTYCNVNTTTCPGGGTSVSGALSYDPSHIYFDSGSQGNTLHSGDVPKIVESALTSPDHLPTDDGAIYLLITAPTTSVSGFCTRYCAYHTKSTTIVSGHTIHYALAPEPNSKCTVCDGNFALGESTTPNGDPGADEIVDSLMHEISETVTDPDLNAWYAPSGAENGDLCNYVYGTATFPSPTTGATANASWGGYSYLIQLIWKNGPLPQGCAPTP